MGSARIELAIFAMSRRRHNLDHEASYSDRPQAPIYPHRCGSSADDFGNLSGASLLCTETSKPHTAVGHLHFLPVLDRAVCFALQTKALDAAGRHASESWNLFKEVLSKKRAFCASYPLLGVENLKKLSILSGKNTVNEALRL